MYHLLGKLFLFYLYVQLGFSQFIRRSSSGDEIISGSQDCLKCSSLLDSSTSEQCSKKCKCKGYGTVLPLNDEDGPLVCSRPSRTTMPLAYGCNFNLLTEAPIPSMAVDGDTISLISEKGLGNIVGCQVQQDSSYFWTDGKWAPLFTEARNADEFGFRPFRGKAFLQWKGSPKYSGMLIKLGIQCNNIAPSCLLLKIEGKISVNPKQLPSPLFSGAHLRQRRNAANSNSTTTQAAPSTTPTPKPTTKDTTPTKGTTVPQSIPKTSSPNATVITTKSTESDNKVLLYLAMVCGAALVLVIIPVVGIAINNRMKQRKVKKAAVNQKKSNEGGSNGDAYVIPGDRRSRSSTATVTVEDGSQISSVKSSRRGSLDPSALGDIRRQSIASLRMQDTRDMRRGSTIEQSRPRSLGEMRRGSLPVNDLRPRGLSELRTPDLRDLRLQSLSNMRSLAPLTPEFRRSQSASDTRVQRLNPNALRDNIMAGIEESDGEMDDGIFLNRMLDPRRNSMISLRSVSSTSALPDPEDGNKTPALSNLLDETEKQNALGENKFSPQPSPRALSPTNMPETTTSPQPQRKISTSDMITYNSLPSRKLSMNLPDKDYEDMNNNKSEDNDDDVFKLKALTPSHHSEPSYTKFFK